MKKRALAYSRDCRPAVVVAALCLILAACGGSETAAIPESPAAPSLVVKGSSSRTATAAAPAWWQRALAWLAPRAAYAQMTPAGSPTPVRMRFHSLLLSTNADCSGPYVTVQSFDPPLDVDLMTNPTLFESTTAAGTFRCLILEVDDVVEYRVDNAAQTAYPAQCSTAQTYQTDLYRAPDTDFRRPDGTTISGAGSFTSPNRQRVFFFVTTDPAAATSRTNGPSANQTLALPSPLTLPGQRTFYFDANNGIAGYEDDGVNVCAIENVAMGFR